MKDYFKKIIKIVTVVISAGYLSLNFSAQTIVAAEPTTLSSEEQQGSGWKFNKKTKTLSIQNGIIDEIIEIYESNEGGVKFSASKPIPWYSYTNDIEKIIMDDKIKVLPKAIFSNLPNLTEVEIPSSVTEIQEYAFYNCTSLESIKIPDATSSIGFEAFFNCKNLKEITFGSSFKSLDRNVFGGCSLLKAIHLSPDNLYFTIQDGILYNKDLTKLVLVFDKKVNKVTIPNTIEIIDSLAFANCNNLKQIVIPPNVKEIAEGAFYNCVNLETLTFAKNSKCKTISDFNKGYGDELDETYGAFENCASLTSLTFPDSLERIDYYTLNNCASLIQISFGSKFVSANGSFGYKGLSKLTTIKVSSKNKTFSSSNGILFNKSKTELLWYPQNKPENTYKIPTKIKIIGINAFQDNKNLSNLNLSSVEEIYRNAFYECAKLKTVKWSKKLKFIGESAFANCHKLESFVSYGNKLKIAHFAFRDCSSLNNINLKSGIYYIGDYAFFGCSFKKVTIPASAKRLINYSFGYYEVDDSFKKIKDFTIYCKKNSAAHKYAKSNKFKYKYY